MKTSSEETHSDRESPNHSETHPGITRSRAPLITVLAAILLLAGLGLLAFTFRNSGNKDLFPNFPTFTPLAGTISSEVLTIGFGELNADPALQQNKRLQITGAFTPVEPPECLNYTGPLFLWSLVADELQLNAIGFEDVLRQVSPGIEMTVTGVWRVYQGPVGCGKEPSEGTVWYLQVDRIIEPNPLFGSGGPMLTVISGTQQPLQSLIDNDPTSTPGLTATISLTSSLTQTVTLASTIVTTPTLQLTPAITPTATMATPLTPGTPTPSVSPGSGTPPDTTGTPDGTTTPVAPTQTPSGTGYPGQPTPPGGYP